MFASARLLARSPRCFGLGARALSDASHMPPIKLFGVNARYANAAYIAASKTGKLSTVQTEMQAIAMVLKNNVAFATTLANPTVGRGEKVQYLDKVLGDQISSVTKNLLLAMAENARLNELPKVAESFEALMKAKDGVVDASVTSAADLTSAQTKAIQKALESTLKSGQTISLTSTVDPKLIGGLQVQIGDKYMDLSVTSKIDRIKRALL